MTRFALIKIETQRRRDRFWENKPIQNRRRRKNVLIDDIASNAFKVL